MTYDALIERLFTAKRLSEACTPLEAATALHVLLDSPAFSYPTIHVAGSNGKGSVATKIAKILELSGYRVGLYTSPHLFSPCERIVVNAQPIEEGEMSELLQNVFRLSDMLPFSLKPSFFELITCLAFEYFRKQKVDVAVIETGLGGRLDATNLIHPLLSIITSISKEHTHLLGEDLALIAREKAGIIKPKTPVVLGPKARLKPIYDRAEELESPVFVSKKISQFFDEENSAIAHLSSTVLSSHFTTSEEALKIGLQLRPACRFQRKGQTLFDVAHNPEAIFSLLQALHSFFPTRKFRFVVGFSKDKDYRQCLSLLADVASHVHLVQSDFSRAVDVGTLKVEYQNRGEAIQAYSLHASVREGVLEAYREALTNDELLVVTGSFYIMAEAIETVLNLERIHGFDHELDTAHYAPPTYRLS